MNEIEEILKTLLLSSSLLHKQTFEFLLNDDNKELRKEFLLYVFRNHINFDYIQFDDVLDIYFCPNGDKELGIETHASRHSVSLITFSTEDTLIEY